MLKDFPYSGYALFHGDEQAITAHSAEALLERGLRRSTDGSGFVFARDLKQNNRSLYGYPMIVWREFAVAIKCPHMIVSAKSRPHYFDEGTDYISRLDLR